MFVLYRGLPEDVVNHTHVLMASPLYTVYIINLSKYNITFSSGYYCYIPYRVYY